MRGDRVVAQHRMALLKHVVNAEHRQCSKNHQRNCEQNCVVRIEDHTRDQQAREDNAKSENNESWRKRQLESFHRDLSGLSERTNPQENIQSHVCASVDRPVASAIIAKNHRPNRPRLGRLTSSCHIRRFTKGFFFPQHFLLRSNNSAAGKAACPYKATNAGGGAFRREYCPSSQGRHPRSTSPCSLWHARCDHRFG